MSNDTAGHPRIDFAWGNMPMQPNTERGVNVLDPILDPFSQEIKPYITVLDGNPNTIIQTPQALKDQPSRATVLASYQFVISEMTKAAGLMDQQIKDKAFININAMNALLARIYLYRGENEKAVEYATKVIASGDFQLLDAAKYQDVFRSKLNAESIFELLFDNS